MAEKESAVMAEKGKKKKNVPNLRFPGFEGEWEEKWLGEIVEFKVTNSFSRDNLNYVGGTTKNIHYGDIHTKFQTLFDITKEVVPFINDDIDISRIPEGNYCKVGDIVFADASEDLNDVGKSIEIVQLDNEKLLSGLHTLLARPKKIFHVGFNGYLFMSKGIRGQIQKEAQGTKVLSISAGRISKIEVAFPSIQEQEKIATLLELIDERIATQNKIIERLETLIKGLREMLFSQKSKPDGSMIKWETKRLGEICDFHKGGSLSKQDLVKDGYFKCIHYGELFTAYGAVISNILSYTNSNGFKSKKGDILMPSSDVTPIGLATASALMESGIVLGGDINILRPNSNVNPIFLSYLLNSEKKRIIELVSGTTIKHIYAKDLQQIKLHFPPLEEQAKIARFLFSFDKKKEKEAEILIRYEIQKKYFLQNLFK